MSKDLQVSDGHALAQVDTAGKGRDAQVHFPQVTDDRGEPAPRRVNGEQQLRVQFPHLVLDGNDQGEGSGHGL